MTYQLLYTNKRQYRYYHRFEMEVKMNHVSYTCTCGFDDDFQMIMVIKCIKRHLQIFVKITYLVAVFDVFNTHQEISYGSLTFLRFLSNRIFATRNNHGLLNNRNLDSYYQNNETNRENIIINVHAAPARIVH